MELLTKNICSKFSRVKILTTKHVFLKVLQYSLQFNNVLGCFHSYYFQLPGINPARVMIHFFIIIGKSDGVED